MCIDARPGVGPNNKFLQSKIHRQLVLSTKVYLGRHTGQQQKKRKEEGRKKVVYELLKAVSVQLKVFLRRLVVLCGMRTLMARPDDDWPTKVPQVMLNYCMRNMEQ